ncbi:MAG: hypothetical protein ACI8UO_005686 [Verrucomicrobiales bacterium]|jgi:hypothetical protein
MSESLADFTRRRWLAGGGGLAGSLLWPKLLRAQNANPPAKRAILIYLQGGLSHYESFDPKPEAPLAYRGEFKNIPTSIPGIHFSEHLPRLAKRAHKFNLIRSAYVDSPSHPIAIYQTLTGIALPNASVAKVNRNRIHPSIGAVVARSRQGQNPGLPAYVSIPHSGQLGVRVHYAEAGTLGAEFKPVNSGMLPESARAPFVGPQSLAARADLSLGRLEDRMGLLDSLDAVDVHHQAAMRMISSGAAADAFDLSREPLKQRERYGNHLWGQQTVLARRLAEADVPFTLLNYTLNQERGQDWDTHVDNFGLLKNTLLPPMDLAVSELLDDLEERGMLDSTLVAMYGEFGRTPKINANAGRDHWNNVFSVFLAGGGLKSGVVLGSSTKAGDVPDERPVHFNEVLATIYHQLGVSPGESYLDDGGRPLPVLPSGKPIGELIA